ncbi:putative secondary metabolism biosynthetic enzyme [Penicillium ochrochloron]
MDDGSILFCGRKNTQVKVGGQWVELSEVENCSRQCFPGVFQFVVEYMQDQSLLAGFVTWQDDRLNDSIGTSSILLPDSAEFQQRACLARRWMLDLVPEYMIPVAFIPVRQIPLGLTGKADRQQFRDILSALFPQDLWKYVAGEKETAMPSTTLETRLQQIYASVLGAPAELISVEDDFFHLGGNSLAAMKISSRSRIDSLQISFSDVFQHRTIRRPARSQMSHAVGDAASTAIILDDLRRIYRNEVLETPAPQFSQYAQYVENSSKRAMEYWQEYFLGASPCLFPCQHTDNRGHSRSLPVSIKQDFDAIS